MTVMEEGYLYLEQDDAKESYYFAYTKNGALYYGAANKDMELASDWKLVSVDEKSVDTIH